MIPTSNRPYRSQTLTILLLLAFTFTGCESNSEESPTLSEAELERACYHFTVEGALELTALCQDHRVIEKPDGTLSLTLIHPPVALTFELPPDLEQAEYSLRAPEEPPQEGSIEAALFYSPLDSIDQDFNHKLRGDFTVLRKDEQITALFSFHAQTDEPEAPAVKVRGHLRDLSLSN